MHPSNVPRCRQTLTGFCRAAGKVSLADVAAGNVSLAALAVRFGVPLNEMIRVNSHVQVCVCVWEGRGVCVGVCGCVGVGVGVGVGVCVCVCVLGWEGTGPESIVAVESGERFMPMPTVSTRYDQTGDGISDAFC